MIFSPMLRLEERAPIPVTDVKTSGVAAHETMHAVDDVLWEGGGSETLTVEYPAGSEAHEEVYALGVSGGP